VEPFDESTLGTPGRPETPVKLVLQPESGTTLYDRLAAMHIRPGDYVGYSSPFGSPLTAIGSSASATGGGSPGPGTGPAADTGSAKGAPKSSRVMVSGGRVVKKKNAKRKMDLFVPDSAGAATGDAAAATAAGGVGDAGTADQSVSAFVATGLRASLNDDHSVFRGDYAGKIVHRSTLGWKNFLWTAYASTVFATLRSRFGIDDLTLLHSLCAEPLEGVVGPGAASVAGAGSFHGPRTMLSSRDGMFHIRDVTRPELQAIRKAKKKDEVRCVFYILFYFLFKNSYFFVSPFDNPLIFL
jgi:hypothetical protein